MKRVLFGCVWFVVIYFVACAIAGGIAGGMAGAGDPANASQAGFDAGVRVVSEHRIWFVLGAALVAIVGSALGWLPGTKVKAHSDNTEAP